jgi:hypothetical protein
MRVEDICSFHISALPQLSRQLYRFDSRKYLIFAYYICPNSADVLTAVGRKLNETWVNRGSWEAIRWSKIFDLNIYLPDPSDVLTVVEKQNEAWVNRGCRSYFLNDGRIYYLLCPYSNCVTKFNEAWINCGSRNYSLKVCRTKIFDLCILYLPPPPSRLSI